MKKQLKIIVDLDKLKKLVDMADMGNEFMAGETAFDEEYGKKHIFIREFEKIIEDFEKVYL